MDDLERYIEERKKRSTEFADGFETGYEQFKIGAVLRAAREEAESMGHITPLPQASLPAMAALHAR